MKIAIVDYCFQEFGCEGKGRCNIIAWTEKI